MAFDMFQQARPHDMWVHVESGTIPSGERQKRMHIENDCVSAVRRRAYGKY